MLFSHLIYRPGKRTPISVSKYFSDMVPFVRRVMCIERSGPCVHFSCSCKHFLKANCTRRKFGGCRDPRSRLSGTFSHAGLEGGERRITQGFLGAFSFFLLLLLLYQTLGPRHPQTLKDRSQKLKRTTLYDSRSYFKWLPRKSRVLHCLLICWALFWRLPWRLPPFSLCGCSHKGPRPCLHNSYKLNTALSKDSCHQLTAK